MKQKRLRNYLKTGILLFGIFLFILACQKESFDNVQETVQEKKLKRITLNELNSKIGNSNDYSKLSAMFDVNRPKASSYQQRLETSDNPYLLTDEIAVVTKENITFYTFKIESDTSGNKFYNLVVAMDESQSIRSTRILEYTPSDYWLQDTTQPFNGMVKIQQNDIFSVTEINDLFSARSSDQCVSGVTAEWECNYGNNHAPGEGQSCTSWEYIITVHWEPCPETIDAGDSSGGGGGFPVDGGNTGGGGGGSSDGGSGNNNDDNGNPPDDGENCIVDNNGNCLTDETTPLIGDLGRDRECKKIKKVLEESNPEFMTKVRDLKNKSNLTYETSIAVFEDNSVGEYQGVAGVSTVETLPTSPSSDYVSMAHVHNETETIKSYSVPSVGDLQWIAGRYRDGHINSSKFVAFLATADGTYFALTISNINKYWEFFKFINLTNMSITVQERSEAADKAIEVNSLLELYYNREVNPLISPNAQGTSNNEQQLKYFLQFLEKADAGVTVFESDENFSTFTKVNLNGNNVERSENPCEL